MFNVSSQNKTKTYVRLTWSIRKLNTQHENIFRRASGLCLWLEQPCNPSNLLSANYNNATKFIKNEKHGPLESTLKDKILSQSISLWLGSASEMPHFWNMAKGTECRDFHCHGEILVLANASMPEHKLTTDHCFCVAPFSFSGTCTRCFRGVWKSNKCLLYMDHSDIKGTKNPTGNWPIH